MTKNIIMIFLKMVNWSNQHLFFRKEEYDKRITPEQQEYLKSLKEKKKIDKLKKESAKTQREKEKDFQKPKHPGSPFFEYLKTLPQNNLSW